MNSKSLAGSSDKLSSDDELEWEALEAETKAMERLTHLMSQLNVDYEEGEEL
jgi:hypothetical protein